MVPLVEAAVSRTLNRVAAVARGEAVPPVRRPRGRGSELSPVEKLSVMVALVTVSRNVLQVSRLCGYHPRTVGRIARSADFATFDLLVSRKTLERLTHRRVSRKT